MTKRCLDEGLLQAYLDGELSPETAHDAGLHMAECGTCADALTTLESDDSFFASAFAPDETLSVPTEALRSRVRAEIARLEGAKSASVDARGGLLNFGALAAAFLSLFALAPRRAGAFAGLIAALAFGLLFYASQSQRTPVELATPVQTAELRDLAAPLPSGAASEELARSSEETRSSGIETQAGEPSNVSGTSGEAVVVNASQRSARVNRAVPSARRALPVEPNTELLLPGERNYREAIASLTKAVEASGDSVMRPKVRIEYERNIALLDRAIQDTRRVALRNPKNKEAVDFLMTAYQSKVDLLTTIADQTQVAALGR